MTDSNELSSTPKDPTRLDSPSVNRKESVTFAPRVTIHGSPPRDSSTWRAKSVSPRRITIHSSSLPGRTSSWRPWSPQSPSPRNMSTSRGGTYYISGSKVADAIRRRKQEARRNTHRRKCEKVLEITVYATSPLCIVCSLMATVVGGTTLDECPLEPMIPVFALMFGCFSVLVHSLTWIWYKFEYDALRFRGDKKMNWLELCLIVLHSILFIWIVQGFIWTFYKFDQLSLKQSALSDKSTAANYCNTILYFVSVAFPIGHVVMVFVVLLPKKVLSRQLEDKLPPSAQQMTYTDFDLVSADNMTQNDVSVKFDDD